MPILRPWHQTLFFVLIVCLLLGPGIFHGDILAFRDSLHFYYPLWHYLDDLPLAERLLPDWNPYDAGGISMSAEPTTAAYYPLRLFFFVPGLSLGTRIALYIAFHFLVAYLGMQLFVRNLSFSNHAANVAAIAFSLSGPLFFQIYNPVFLVGGAWLPFAALFLERITKGQSSIWNLIGLGIVLAMMVLGGDPQMAVHVVLIGSVIVILAKLRDRSSPLIGPSLSILVACLIASLLSAVQILPTVAWLQQSRRGGVGIETYEFSVAPWQWITFFLPRFFGSFAGENSRWVANLPGESRMWVASLHIGTIGCFGFLYAVFKLMRRIGDRQISADGVEPDVEKCSPEDWRHRLRVVQALAVVAAISAVSSLGAYGLGWLMRSVVLAATGSDDFEMFSDPFGGLQWIWNEFVPGYASFRYPAKWLVLSAAGTSVLAGIGIDQICRNRNGTSSKWIGIGSLLGLSLFVAAALISLTPSFQESWQTWCKETPVDSLCGPLSPQSSLRCILVSLAIVTISLASFWLVLRLNIRYETRMSLLGILLLLELGFVAWSDCYYIDELKLISASKSKQQIEFKESLPSWESLALRQVQRRVGKFHLLVPERNWNAQLTLTPTAVATLRDQPELLKEAPSRMRLNAGWDSKKGGSWDLLREGDSNAGQVTATWMSHRVIRLVYDLPQEGRYLLPVFQDGGWQATDRDSSNNLTETPIVIESHYGVLSSLLIPEGSGEIHVAHETPGLRLGAWISTIAWMLAISLCLTSWRKKDAISSSLSLRESRPLRAGEGPPRPLPRPTLAHAF